MGEQAKAKLVAHLIVDVVITVLCVALLGPLGFVPAFLILGALHRKG